MAKEILSITNQIYIIRGQKVMFDFDLAEAYGVSVGRLNEQVKRNNKRFPSDFCFKLDFNELADIKSQIAIRSDVSFRKGVTPTAFTEQGAYALSFILRSNKAVEMGIFIARAFSYLRRFVLKNENLMMELKNNDQLSKIFSSFEKRIEKDLIVLYKNVSKYETRFKAIEKKLRLVEARFGK